MNPKNIRTAIAEAERFLERARALLQTQTDSEPGRDDWDFTGSRQTGATKRASLDLSRALADMRKVTR